jgi:uncharacterized membrane protein (DUF2068 family)
VIYAGLTGALNLLSLMVFLVALALTTARTPLSVMQVAMPMMWFGTGVAAVVAAYGLWVRKWWGRSLGVVLYGAQVAVGVVAMMTAERSPTRGETVLATESEPAF